jgi:hypothetical protein
MTKEYTEYQSADPICTNDMKSVSWGNKKLNQHKGTTARPRCPSATAGEAGPLGPELGKLVLFVYIYKIQAH